MVNTADFYKHTEISWDDSVNFDPLGTRLTSLLDEVIKKLPDEDWFKIKGLIMFVTRQKGIEYWCREGKNWGSKPDFSSGTNGSAKVKWMLLKKNKMAEGKYIITIIIDDLDSKTDEYIKGLMIHELSEMTDPFRKLAENWDSFKKMKPKAIMVMMDKLTNAGAGDFESKEYREHEDNINNECIRLGFQKEIDALLAKN